MGTTSLHDRLAALGARMGRYEGAETPASFTDPETELVALRSTCGVYDLSWRGKLILTGSDRVRWLNGMVTNNIRDLAPNMGTYNFVLSPQGRIQGDLCAYNRGEYLLLTTDLVQVTRLKEFLEKYIIMDDVEITDATEKLAGVSVTGPTAHEILMRAGFELPSLIPGQVFDSQWNQVGLSLVRGLVERVQSYEIWVHPDNAAGVWDALVSAGATPVGTDALEQYRILQGIPRYGVDISDRDLPQETAQENALHFAKGCYIGQEIVERIRSRGNVHRTFAGFLLSGEPLPERGAKLQYAGKDVGEITSAAAIVVDGLTRHVALGYVRREASAPGTEVAIGSSTAQVAALPFKF